MSWTTFRPESREWFRDLSAKYGEACGPGKDSDVSYQLDTNGDCPVGVIKIDDGKMNAFSFSVIARFEACLVS